MLLAARLILIAVAAILVATPSALAGQVQPSAQSKQAMKARLRQQKVKLTPPPKPHLVASRKGPLQEDRTALVEFATAPFPYLGTVPRTGRPFLDYIDDEGRRGHMTGSGRVYWEDEKYSDKRVLLHIPKGFDIRKPAFLVVFFHGHGATLERDVRDRQRVAAQISASGLNAVLAAPQLALAASDSSAGKFWQPGVFGRFTGEAAQQLATLLGDKRAVRTFASLPVIIVAYSGGFQPAAWCAERGGLKRRVKGVVLFDSLYGEMDKFVSWITANRSGFFVTSHLGSTRGNNEQLGRILSDKKIPYKTEWGERLKPGSVHILAGSSDANHRSFMTKAWVDYPLADLLAKLKGFGK